MDFIAILRAVFGLVFVLGLVALCAYGLKRLPMAPGFRLNPNAKRRLGIAERVTLDARRQLVIVQDGAREHLILLGATGETIIESRSAAVDAAMPSGDGSGLRLVEPGSRS